jgi:hypothetical protein
MVTKVFHEILWIISYFLSCRQLVEYVDDATGKQKGFMKFKVSGSQASGSVSAWLAKVRVHSLVSTYLSRMIKESGNLSMSLWRHQDLVSEPKRL